MTWIDQERREAFEKLFSDQENRQPRGADTLMRIVPEELRNRAVPIGNEWILSYEDALAAVSLATLNQIAVLGFDAGEVQANGFQIVDYSDDRSEFAGDWKEYVRACNADAEDWMKKHRYGRNFGYIVSSTSEKEFAQLLRRN